MPMMGGPLQLELFPAANGEPTARAALPGGPGLLLHSRYDPGAEAADLVGAHPAVAESGIVIVLGQGLGYHIREALRRMREDGRPREETRAVVVIDPFIAAFPEESLAFDVRSAHPQVFRLAEAHEAVAMLTSLSLNAIRHKVSLVEHPPSVQLAPEFYRRARAAIREWFGSVRIDLGTTRWLSYFTLDNVARNSRCIARDPGPRALAGLLAGKPAVVVGAGPSLAESLDGLRRMQGRACIIAAGSAYRPLLAAGIVPDFVCAIDPTEQQGRDFADIEARPVPLCYESRVHPDVLSHFVGPRFCFSMAGLLPHWLSAISVEHAPVGGGGTVASTAIGLAETLGCDPIVLTALDLAYTKPQSHADGCHYNVPIDLARDPERFIEAAAIGGGTVMTTRLFLCFLRVLERQFRALGDKGVTVIDATAAGLAKEGTVTMPLAAVAERYCTEDLAIGREVEEVYARHRLPDERLPRVVREMERLGRRLTSFRDLLLRSANRIAELRRVMELLEAPFAASFRPSLVRRARALFEQVYAENQRINARRQLANFLDFFTYMMNFVPPKPDMSIEEQIEINGLYYTELVLGLNSFLPAWEESVGALRAEAAATRKARRTRPMAPRADRAEPASEGAAAALTARQGREDALVTATVNATYHELAEGRSDTGWELEYGPDYWRYRWMWEEYPKRRKVHSFPIHLDIEPTNACDLRCPMCPRTIMFENGELGPVGFFDHDLYCQIVADGVKRGLKSIKLNYLGEPLLHKRIVDMVRFAKEQGVLEVMFNSNGTQLTEDLSRRLIEAGLDRIIFSFDGADRETYEKIRIGASYDKVVANIRRFVQIRNEMGRRLPVVRISMVLMKSNGHQLQQFIEFWKPVVDLVTYSDYVNPQEKYTDEEYTVELDEKEPFCCGQLWQRLFVWQDGSVTPCCADYDKKLLLGNVKRGDRLVDLWHSERLNEWRRLHAEGRYREIEACRMCGVPRMAKALGYTAQAPDE